MHKVIKPPMKNVAKITEVHPNNKSFVKYLLIISHIDPKKEKKVIKSPK